LNRAINGRILLVYCYICYLKGERLLTAPAPLAKTAAALRTGQLDLLTYINELCVRIEAVEPTVQALLPEPHRRARLLSEAVALQARYPSPEDRPPLYGVPVGVKDVFVVDGFPTQAGSQLPLELFVGQEATCVSLLRQAGALIAGKTISTEFAYFEPGPTRNPHNPDHTPGGSSSGSAAAVAAGLCPLALGTQTIGSTIRPAAFCGIIGFKPTYGRIPTAGLILCSISLDTVGFFTQDIAGAALVASLLCLGWQQSRLERLPVLGVPDGPYLAQATSEALAAFEEQLAQLQQAGCTVHRIPVMEDIEAINQRHTRLVFAEMAQMHHTWFARYEALYRPRTAAAIREGQEVSEAELATCRASRERVRSELETAMKQEEVDLWVSPAAPGGAPEGITSTGSPLMNLPWTHAGMPAITLPCGHAPNGLPLGLQLVAATMADEQLLAWAEKLAECFASSQR
jgi:Asp-tRNA(Asn)/Glu-tRNA(Gln) amidotransferase A subunit family amidase